MKFEIGGITAKLELEDVDLVPLRSMLSKAVANGVYNAIRALINDGYLAALAGTQDAAQDPAEPDAAAEPEAPTAPPQPEPPAYGRYMEREPDPPAPKEKKERTKIGSILSTVKAKPSGYITTDEAAAILGAGENDRQQINIWIRTKQVNALIVDDGKLTPTKGAGGRVMVEKQSVIRRNKLRLENAKLLPKDRRSFEYQAAAE